MQGNKNRMEQAVKIGYTPINTKGVCGKKYCSDMEGEIYADKLVCEDIVHQLRKKHDNPHIKVGVIYVEEERR